MENRKEHSLRVALSMSQQHPKGVAVLENKNLNTEDMRIVSEYIMSPQASSLKRFWLGGNLIGDEGGEMICNALLSSPYCVLEGLTLNNTKIGINTLKAIGEYLLSTQSNQLIYLNLSNNIAVGYNNGINILTSALAHNTTLTRLDLDDCHIGERGGKELEFLLSNYNSTLIWLDLTHSDLTDKLRNRIYAITKYRNRSRVLEPPPYAHYSTKDDNSNNNSNNLSQCDLSKLELLITSLIRPLGNELQTLRNLVESQNNTIANLQSEINMQKSQIADQQQTISNLSTNISQLEIQFSSRTTTENNNNNSNYF